MKLPTKENDRLLRINQVLERIPVSRSGWMQGVREGRYPAAIRLSPRVTVWREADIIAMIEQFGQNEVAQ